MKRTSITDAKNGLSALIDHVRQGETVIIEDRGVAVARIGPVGAGDDSLDADRLARLERSGVIAPRASGKPSAALGRRPPRPKAGVALSRLVTEERAGGW